MQPREKDYSYTNGYQIIFRKRFWLVHLYGIHYFVVCLFYDSIYSTVLAATASVYIAMEWTMDEILT